MEKGEMNFPLLERTGKLDRYDPRLIREAVNLVESGVPRKVVKERFDLGKSTLSQWMRDHGSAFYQENKRRVYSKTEKRKIANAVCSGQMTVQQAAIAYQIKSESLIRGWVRGFQSEKADISIPTITDMPKKHSDNPSEDVVALRKALAEAQLKIEALNTLIDVAEDQLKIDIRKKSGAKQSSK